MFVATAVQVQVRILSTQSIGPSVQPIGELCCSTSILRFPFADICVLYICFFLNTYRLTVGNIDPSE